MLQINATKFEKRIGDPGLLVKGADSIPEEYATFMQGIPTKNNLINHCDSVI